MRIALAALAILLAGALTDTARADPYRWCAEYGGGDVGGGGGNCYFMTLEQCQAQISGLGGFCRENLLYDGRNGGTRKSEPPPRRKKQQS